MRNRNKFNQIKDQFCKVPNGLFHMGLSPGSVALFCYLLSNTEDYNPSIRYVAKVLSVTPNSIRKYYLELESRNIIKCYHKGYKGITGKWEFVPMSSWISN